MSYLCDVIVLSWNYLDITKRFLESFLPRAHNLSRLIIIDNASTDGTPEYLSSLKDTPDCAIKVILNSENKGFVGGMNQGIAISNAPYVCLANNDLIFTDGWLEEIISLFEKHKDIGVLNPNSNNLGVRVPCGMSLDDFAKDLKDKYSGVFVEMPFCIGFCMFIRREVIDKVGVLSKEFYPMLFEDSDFSMKARSAGYLIGMAKASYVWHEEHASIEKIGDEKEKIFLKSRETFIKKWGRLLRLAWVVNGYDELLDALGKGIDLARKGNFVWFFVRGLKKKRIEIFAEKNLTEHSGIHFAGFSNIFDLMWKIAKKKKRYDVVMGKNRFTQYIFSRLGYKVLPGPDDGQIAKLKTGS